MELCRQGGSPWSSGGSLWSTGGSSWRSGGSLLSSAGSPWIKAVEVFTRDKVANLKALISYPGAVEAHPRPWRFTLEQYCRRRSIGSPWSTGGSHWSNRSSLWRQKWSKSVTLPRLGAVLNNWPDVRKGVFRTATPHLHDDLSGRKVRFKITRAFQALTCFLHSVVKVLLHSCSAVSHS